MTPFGIALLVIAGISFALIEAIAIGILAIVEWRRALKQTGGYMSKKEVTSLLREIEAKKQLGYTLTEREQALLALYGKGEQE